MFNSKEEIADFLKGTRKPGEEPMVFDDRRSYEDAIYLAKAWGPEGAKLLEALIEFGKTPA